MEISAASFAYPQHEGAFRARLAERLAALGEVRKGFLLSTCLRVEIAVPGPEPLLRETLHDLFGDLIAGDIQPRVRFREEAVGHLYRVAAGLESPILGEQEILTQFRQSLIEAEASGAVEGVFARLLEMAVAAGRHARELLPGSPHNSMAAVAAQAVGTSSRVAVLGSGIMASAIVEGLALLPAPPEITVVARNPEKVAERPGIEVLSFEMAEETLRIFPAVISATSAKHRVIDDVTLAAVVAARKDPLLLIDMAMPPDFRPPEGASVTYLDIDRLARMADRRSRSEGADALVAAAASDAYRQYRDHHEIGPLISGMMEGADLLVEETVRRFSGRLRHPEDETALRQAVHTVVRKLLAGPVGYLKKEDRSAEAIDVIADAFGVDGE
ncbi:glutamyl-tRNA reductase [soil metagenome]